MKKWFSQLGQDKFVIEKIFSNKKNGVFVEVGAHDGKYLSNTFMLEKKYNWSGVCIEPSVRAADLKRARQKSLIFNYCICSKEFDNKIVRFREFSNPEISVTLFEDLYNEPHLPKELKREEGKFWDRLKMCKTLDFTLEESGLKKDIDYISIDIQGSEWLAIKDFPFDKWNVKVFTIANDMYVGGEKKKNRDKTKSLMEKNGYKLTKAFSLKHLNIDNWDKDYEDDIIEELYVKQGV